jgi:DHA3 family macrolide efflux protein-like MFS transporter
MKTKLRNARLFIISESLILFFCMTVNFAISWYVTLSTNSPVMVAIITALTLMPTFLLAPVAGVFADRHNRKKLLIITYSIIGFYVLVLAAIYTGGYYHIWMELTCVVAIGIGQAVLFPTVGSVIPDIIDEDEVTKLNAFRSVSESIALFSAPAIGGVLLSNFTFEKVLYLGVAFAAAGITVLTFFVKIPNKQKPDALHTNSFLTDLIAGVKYIAGSRMLKTLFCYLIFFELVVAPITLLNQILVIRNYGAEYWRLTVNETSYFVGMVLGGIVLTAWGGFKRNSRNLAHAAAGFGVCSAMLAVMNNFWGYIFFMFMSGVFMPLYDAPAQTLIETRTSPAFTGRVFAVATMIMNVGLPIDSIVIAPLEEQNLIPIKLVIFIPGVIIALSSLYFFVNREKIDIKPTDGEKE